jgi:hypothetical protein
MHGQEDNLVSLPAFLIWRSASIPFSRGIETSATSHQARVFDRIKQLAVLDDPGKFKLRFQQAPQTLGT